MLRSITLLLLLFLTLTTSKASAQLTTERRLTDDTTLLLMYLFCLSRNEGDVSKCGEAPSVFGSSGTEDPEDPEPEPTVYLEQLGSRGSLRMCQGDCNTDTDCAGSLKCFLRGETGVPRDEPVPGCITGDAPDFVDFCYDPNWATSGVTGQSGSTESPTSAPSVSNAPSDVPSKSPSKEPTPPPTRPDIPSGDFRLRLWWKKGYTWQGNPNEQWFCLRCDSGRTCENGDKVKVYNTCDTSSTSFEFLEVPGTNGEQILLKDHRSSLCLRYEDRRDVPEGGRGYNAIYMRMRRCDEDDDRQKWETKGNGQFWEDRFEIWSILEGDTCDDYERDGCKDRCTTMMHHPRRGEEIWSEDCWLARRDATSFWAPHYY